MSEIQQLLGVCHQGSPVCPLVRELLDRKIPELKEQIYRMTALDQELEAYRDGWADKPLDDPSSKELCSLIEEVACQDVAGQK